ncbi:MAG TPA: glycerol-3-phosphate acyltransferase [Acidimicrobiales bacterium]|nr:glycerol-3-phosphate acyltransferase [Acidimicrobiales bacterium]
MRTATLAASTAAIGAGYVLGSVPVAVLVGRLHGVDPRTVGDANPGYWNLREHLGARPAAPVFAGDTAKGVAAALVGRALAPAGAWGVGYAAVGAAMAGHAWPAFAGFRGGRSVLTWAGGMCVLSPPAGLVSVAAFAAVAASGSFAWGARLGVFAFPVIQAVTEGPHRVAATGALMSIIGLRFATADRQGAERSEPCPDGTR